MKAKFEAKMPVADKLGNAMELTLEPAFSQLHTARHAGIRRLLARVVLHVKLT